MDAIALARPRLHSLWEQGLPMADPERTLRAGGGVDGTGIRGGSRTNGDAGWTGRGEASRAGLGD